MSALQKRLPQHPWKPDLNSIHLYGFIGVPVCSKGCSNTTEWNHLILFCIYFNHTSSPNNEYTGANKYLLHSGCTGVAKRALIPNICWNRSCAEVLLITRVEFHHRSPPAPGEWTSLADWPQCLCFNQSRVRLPAKDSSHSCCQSSTPEPSKGSPCLHTLWLPTLLNSLILGLRKKKKKKKKGRKD